MARVEVTSIRRVVVGFADAAAAADVVIATAAELAHALNVELTGLFIEDALLFDATAFPWLRAIEPRRLLWQSLDTAQVTELHALAARAAERLLLGKAAAFGVAAGFQIVRGDPATTLARRCEPSDLLVIAEPADPIARTLHPYPSLVRAIWETHAAVLYVPHGARSRAGPVVAVAEAADDAALALAAPVAAALKERLIVLAAAQPESEQAIARAARTLTGGDCVVLRLNAAATGSWPDAMSRALAPYRERLLIVSRAGLGGDLESYLRLARDRTVPLLLAPF